MTDNLISLPKLVSIREIQQENYRTKTFVLDASLQAIPGQFIMSWLPRFDEKPFSLVNSDPVTLMISAVGPFTRLVHEKQVGDSLWIRGPFGNGFHVDPAHKRPALLGGGYGVAPLLWLAQQQAPLATSITTIIGARSAAELLYVSRFRAIGDSPACRAQLALYTTTEDGSQGMPGRVTDVLEPLLAGREVDSIYACGPHGMLGALERLGQRYAVPCQLSWEAYMRCAIGLCGSCEHNGKLLCLDGPVM